MTPASILRAPNYLTPAAADCCVVAAVMNTAVMNAAVMNAAVMNAEHAAEHVAEHAAAVDCTPLHVAEPAAAAARYVGDRCCGAVAEHCADVVVLPPQHQPHHWYVPHSSCAHLLLPLSIYIDGSASPCVSRV
jgi:hypothetical protein